MRHTFDSDACFDPPKGRYETGGQAGREAGRQAGRQNEVVSQALLLGVQRESEGKSENLPSLEECKTLAAVHAIWGILVVHPYGRQCLSTTDKRYKRL